jgi:hypothetical protein
MKELILVCDRCTISIPAIATVTLTNGKGKPISIDVCKKHQVEVYKIFTPMHAGKATPISNDEWSGLLESTLKYVVKHKEVTPKTIMNDTGLPVWRVAELLKELVKGKKIRKVGVGRSTKYQAKGT